MADSPAFLAQVTRWLQQKVDPAATDVMEVRALSSNWDGNTVEGFHSSFDIEILYHSGGLQKRIEVGAGEMQSLWEFVVSGYPHA